MIRPLFIGLWSDFSVLYFILLSYAYLKAGPAPILVSSWKNDLFLMTVFPFGLEIVFDLGIDHGIIPILTEHTAFISDENI